MKRSSALFAGLLASLAMLAVASPASAQATRTWVSGVGDDANPCSRTAPCKTFAGAISKTATGGEIDVLDPGGFGAVTITKSITIDGGGFVASVLNSGGISGIIINITGGQGVVVLRNLQISGAGLTFGARGVRLITEGAKTLTLDNVRIQQQSVCGVCAEATTRPVKVVIDHSQIISNPGDGILVNAPTAGANGTQNRVTVRNSTISGNGGAGVHLGPATNSSFKANALAFTSLISDNADGILSDGVSARMHISDNDITGNNNGLRIANSGRIISFQNNRLNANNTDGVPTSTLGQD
jgi:hypothetical protein